jgi:hypothetical protein
MNDVSMKRDLPDLYDDAKDELVRGFTRADQCVYGFARHYGISSKDAWRLIAQEAAARGDDVVRYLSENPLDERSDDRKAVDWQLRSGSEVAGVAVSSRRPRAT